MQNWPVGLSNVPWTMYQSTQTVPPPSMSQTPMPGQHSAQPWQQLRRVSIPKFNGDKTKYESWIAAFSACIDNAPAAPECKLLQKKQYLTGEPLQAAGCFGFSPSAYDAAKDLLERKYGVCRRKLALHLEEIDNVGSIGHRKLKELEHFTDLLSTAVVTIKDAGQQSE